MVKPSKYMPKDCPMCGGQGKIVNPAWIKWRRLERAMTLCEASKMIGISAQYLCDIEKGRRNCPTRVADFMREK